MPFAIPRTPSARITLRASLEGKALIEYAAAITGETVSSFVLKNACEAASQIVADDAARRLLQEAVDAFASAVEPQSSPAALKKTI